MVHPNDHDQGRDELRKSPELLCWRHHRQLFANLPHTDRWRGCIGLALMPTRPSNGVNFGDRFFIPNHDLRWLSILDLPDRRKRKPKSRIVQIAKTFPTYSRLGMPTLGYKIDSTWDISHSLSARAGRPRRGLGYLFDSIDPQQRQAWLRVWNSIKQRMFEFASASRADGACDRISSIQGNASASAIRLTEDSISELSADPVEWMPRPFLAFRSCDRKRILEWTIRKGASDDPCNYSPEFRTRLLRDIRQSMPIRAPLTGTYSGMTATKFGELPIFALHFANQRHSFSVRVSRMARIYVSPGQPVK